jgi:hypothetical protein
MSSIGRQKDLWAGVIYFTIAAILLVFGQRYSVGTANRMGPGYFPLAVAYLLLVCGAVSLARALLVRNDPVAPLAWRNGTIIVGSVISFAFLLQPVGLVGALTALLLISAAASEKFRLDAKPVAGMAAFIVLCVLGFVKGLGLPMPIFGTGLEPIVPLWLQ